MGMSEEARKARNKYLREWRKKNKDKVRQHQRDYWERLAERREEKASS